MKLLTIVEGSDIVFRPVASPNGVPAHLDTLGLQGEILVPTKMVVPLTHPAMPRGMAAREIIIQGQSWSLSTELPVTFIICELSTTCCACRTKLIRVVISLTTSAVYRDQFRAAAAVDCHHSTYIHSAATLLSHLSMSVSSPYCKLICTQVPDSHHIKKHHINVYLLVITPTRLQLEGSVTHSLLSCQAQSMSFSPRQNWLHQCQTDEMRCLGKR